MEIYTCSKCGFKNEKKYFNKVWGNNRGRCKQCKSKLDKSYAERMKDKLKAYYKKKWAEDSERRLKHLIHTNIKRYGFANPFDFVKDKKCANCGITNQEHIDRYGERLNIHHKDDFGRKAMKQGLKPNNKLSNLEVLCRSCHCKVSNEENQEYTGRGKKIWEKRKLTKSNNQ